MAVISLFQPKILWAHLQKYFTQESGGKKIILLKRTGAITGGVFLASALGMAWFGPKDDRTFYVQTSRSQDKDKNPSQEVPGVLSGAIVALFDNGRKKMDVDKQNKISRRKKQISIKYFAPQIIGSKGLLTKQIRSGAKLVGFLLNAIDTRSSSSVRVRVAQGGEVGGVEIQKGSVLTGQYSYPGTGEKIYISFMRIDTAESEPKKIQAQALDSGSYTPGISGEVFTDGGTKVAASLGLTMFAGMADVMTEKESLGLSQNSVQAKSTMKNALLQGMSRSAQDQTNRMAADINSVKDYVIVPEGKEMIIELTEDFK